MSNTVPEGAENLLKIDLSFFSRSSFVDDCVGAIARCSVRGEMGDVRLKLGVRVVPAIFGRPRSRHVTKRKPEHSTTACTLEQRKGYCRN
jgi:hypothetical protein